MDKDQKYKTLVSSGRYVEAMAVLDSLLEMNPADDRVLFERANSGGAWVTDPERWEIMPRLWN